MSIPLYIAIYKPRRKGNFYHWSIFIEADDDHIFEVTGEDDLHYRHFYANPESSRGFKENILIGYISQKDVKNIGKVLKSLPIDNDVSWWTCQDWVLEGLEELCTEFILEEDDEDYCRGVKRAKRKYFGPI